jgi:outer membrane biogenesis lipoprotein LolB
MKRFEITADLAQQEKINFMTRFFALFFVIALLASCRSTKKIQTAITKKDSASTVNVPSGVTKNDTIQLIHAALRKVDSNHIGFRTFSAKVNVDYSGSDGKKYDVNANIRMYKDSAIWIAVNALLGIDAMRLFVTKDSLKLLDKLNKTYTARSVDYLREITSLPLNLYNLQDLIIGNPVFLDSNIVSYSSNNNQIALLCLGNLFKNLITLNESDKTLIHSKLDDIDPARNRTADLTYGDYESKKGMPFSTKRRIVVTEKNRLDIKLEFKQYDFNQEVSFPFSVPKNYDRH